MHTAFFHKMANDFAFDYVFWYLLVFVNLSHGARLGAGALWRVQGISVVGQGPGFATSSAQQSAIGLPRRAYTSQN